MLKVIYILLGIFLVGLVLSFIFSKEKNLKQRFQNSLGGGLGAAFTPIWIGISLIFQAIPIVVAIFIVLFILKGCS